ncbi:DNA gyrase inhibitor YacG [Bradyrhizobium sp.]|uniref:DNA gyrase inhibitor YacG n=1 Tax=Bradyrhizobium sp. TaxID=376 RepID=UPI0023953B73|nr:DNA gyrase inhibitor YacG [Bradyrhizobium sp.]MDE1932449.1 DNA gyrase inhibitor YacG [Bradyrhizobium sp.]
MPARPPGHASPEGTKAKPCPICGKPSTKESRPFCSTRCRDVDLNRWLSGSYVIPTRPDEDDDND